MAQFDYKKFLNEGGIEKYLMEAEFGNDPESRYEYIRPLMSRLPDSARTETLIDGMEDGLREDDKTMFDYYFVEAMKELGLESELMEAEDSLINPEAEEIEATDLDAAADYFDSLAENDDVLDEILAEAKFEVGDMVYRKSDGAQFPMKVVGVRKMFASPLHAITVVGTSGGDELEYDETQLVKLMSPEEKANVFVREEVEGEVQTEEMSDQLKINKLLQAANTIEDSLNDVNLELTDDQIDQFTDMILDLRDKVKAKLKKK